MREFTEAEKEFAKEMLAFTPPEAEPVESAEEILNSLIEKEGELERHITALEDELKSVQNKIWYLLNPECKI